MATALVTTIQRFIGLSTDTKPTDVTVGSTYYEADTGLTAVTVDGTTWYISGVADAIQTTVFDLAQAAGDYDIIGAAGGPVMIESVVFALPAGVDCSDDASLTSVTIQTDATTSVELLSAANGAVANLGAAAQFSYSTPFALADGDYIQLTIGGGAADESTITSFFLKYRPLAIGAHLTQTRRTSTTFDLEQAANDYDLFEAAGDVLIESVTFTLPDVDCSDDTSLTAISIQTDDAVPVEIVSTADGAKVNLEAKAEFTYGTPFVLADGQKIQITIAGGAADDATACSCAITYRMVDSGSYVIVS